MSIFRLNHKRAGREERQVPRHIAIIMDGNGRWAKKRALPRSAGHAAGAETFRRVANYCKAIGVQYLTVYAFSTENWKRPDEEVSSIMQLLGKYLREAIEMMERDDIRLRILGDRTMLSDEINALIDRTNEISGRTHGFQSNICINYGGRDEILRAANRFAEDYAGGAQKLAAEENFEKYLDTFGIPDPDLFIRPGGEIRLSNFLLWQSAYAELYFTGTLWPDFGEKDIDGAILEFNQRERRYGGA